MGLMMVELFVWGIGGVSELWCWLWRFFMFIFKKGFGLDGCLVIFEFLFVGELGLDGVVKVIVGNVIFILFDVGFFLFDDSVWFLGLVIFMFLFEEW